MVWIAVKGASATWPKRSEPATMTAVPRHRVDAVNVQLVFVAQLARSVQTSDLTPSCPRYERSSPLSFRGRKSTSRSTQSSILSRSRSLNAATHEDTRSTRRRRLTLEGTHLARAPQPPERRGWSPGAEPAAYSSLVGTASRTMRPRPDCVRCSVDSARRSANCLRGDRQPTPRTVQVQRPPARARGTIRDSRAHVEGRDRRLLLHRRSSGAGRALAAG